MPLADVFTATVVTEAFAEEQVRFGETKSSFWTPALTLWTWLAQTLCADHSCRAAMYQAVVMHGLSRTVADVDTGTYCRARAKIPARVWQRLALHVGHAVEAALPESQRWHKRKVVLVDGSTSTLPDTEENQEAFPQSSTQKPGLGFPIIRWVLLQGLASATVQGFAYGPYAGKETGENALFRQLLDYLEAGDVVLADRFYGSYFMVALLQARGVDVVVRLHQRRKYDFRRGRRLGPDDHVVEWQRPARPEWMDEATYAALPATITVREIRKTVTTPGYRVSELIIATTLLDAEVYSVESVAELYHKRWQVELDIRSLKVTLQMDQLRCKTPFMVEKELWAHLLAYNLVRKVGVQAALLAKRDPRTISFKAVQQLIRASWQQLTSATAADYLRLAQELLRALPKQRVGQRPGRCEPRAVKRRPKAHPRLTEPRQQARAKLQGSHPSKE